MASLEELLKIIGGGSIEQSCFSCNMDFQLARSQPDCCTLRMLAVKTYELGTNKFSCSSSCGKDFIRPWSSVTLYMEEQLVKGVGKSRVCDSCHLVMVSGHRCSGCHTKVYCDQECRERDCQVHSKVCHLLQDEERKKKVRLGPLPATLPCPSFPQLMQPQLHLLGTRKLCDPFCWTQIEYMKNTIHCSFSESLNFLEAIVDSFMSVQCEITFQ